MRVEALGTALSFLVGIERGGQSGAGHSLRNKWVAEIRGCCYVLGALADRSIALDHSERIALQYDTAAWPR